MILRKTDTSKKGPTANTWQTSIDLSTISDFNRFLQAPADPYPIRLFDSTNKIAKYRLVPFDRRLEYKDTLNTAVYASANKLLYLNGTIPHAGTLYLCYIRTTPDFDLTPVQFGRSLVVTHPDPAFHVGIHKGYRKPFAHGCRRNRSARAVAELTAKQLENWDNELQLIEQEGYEPYEQSDGWRPDHINL